MTQGISDQSKDRRGESPGQWLARYRAEGERPARDRSADSSVATGRGSLGSRLVGRVRLGTVGRLVAFHALIIASILAIVVFYSTQAFANRYHSTVVSDLTENVTSFSHAASHRPTTQSLEVFTRSYLANSAHGPLSLLIVSLPGNHVILGTSGSTEFSRSPAIAKLLEVPPKGPVYTNSHYRGEPEIVLAVPIVEGGVTVGTFLTTGSLTNYEIAKTRLIELALGEGLITLIASFISVYLLLRRLLGSVSRLTRMAAAIERSGELGVRLDDAQGADEVGEMAATFNAMIDKIDSAVTLQHQMLSDVSHQLRTPLTVARGHLEVMSRGSLDDPDQTRATVLDVVDELDHMRRLVESLLLLGRSLESDFTDIQPVDVRALLGDLSAAAETLAAREWSLGPIPDVVIYADHDKLRGALLNLIENSVNATESGDSIRLSAQVGGALSDPMVEIMVDDSGPGIAPDERQSVLGRFSRSASARSGGSGLGLAIVGAVARGHKGYVTIGDSPLGGCRVTIAVPLPPEGEHFATTHEEV